MKVRKTLKVPIHYDTTKTKLDKLDRLTARITYAIVLISELITDSTKLDRKTLRELVKNSDIPEKTGLSAGFIDQCIDKVLWAWKSYREQHKEWENKVQTANKRIESAKDEKEKVKKEKSLEKLQRREPLQPDFQNKTPCRIDYRTGKIEKNKHSKMTYLWIHVSTLEKGKTIDIPLNPSHYHINQLKDAEIDDFEIVKKGKKYYAHISITKQIEDKRISSIGGIDQGLNRSVAIVLLNDPIPYEGLIFDAAKRQLLDKYDTIIASLQQAEKWDKLRELRHKRNNVSINYDWSLANQVAKETEGCIIAIGNSDFRQTQYRGNGMPTLRKKIGKWSYSRQRSFIALKRAELGYPTELINEYGTSRECHCCGSWLTTRKWVDSSSYVLCHGCGAKIDADINAAYNIAIRCRDDWLKAGMNMVENRASLQDGRFGL